MFPDSHRFYSWKRHCAPPASIYIPGTDSEAIEIGFGIAECGRTADGSLPETARQLGARAPGRVRPGPQTHVSRQSTRGLKCFAPFFRRFCGLGLSHPEYGLRSAVTGLGAAARPGRFRLAYLLGFVLFFFPTLTPFFVFFISSLEVQFPEPVITTDSDRLQTGPTGCLK